MAERALDAMVPGLVRQVAPLGLGDWPTPVVALDGLGADLYVKRDDLSSALYGGNKVRKLEWLLGAARRAGAHTVVTMTNPWPRRRWPPLPSAPGCGWRRPTPARPHRPAGRGRKRALPWRT